MRENIAGMKNKKIANWQIKRNTTKSTYLRTLKVRLKSIVNAEFTSLP